MTIKYESWGRFPKTEQESQPVLWRDEPVEFEVGKRTVLPYGLGRSYGDCCLNDGGVLLDTSPLNRFISFDEGTGLLKCESGTSLADIIDFALPRGWFLPVSPGTKFVTVGGAIANDIHGKNHHKAGTFGCHVEQFELLRSDGSTRVCSPSQNTDLFSATIGGLGLTGLIVWAEIKLKKVDGPYIDAEHIKFERLSRFYDLSAESDKDYEYTVAWIDCLAKGENFGRGIFIRGNHSKEPLVNGRLPQRKSLLSIPIDFPEFALNTFTMQTFNKLFYSKQTQEVKRSRMHYDPFFYPLDSIGSWNRIYGKRGFFQFQCVVPPQGGREIMERILKKITESGQASFLSVLKMFGKAESPGLLSFPMEGITLSLDIPHKQEKTLQLLSDLDKEVCAGGGRIYPAKDAYMSSESFKSRYPNWEQFSKFIDPKFSSSLWRRVMGSEQKS